MNPRKYIPVLIIFLVFQPLVVCSEPSLSMKRAEQLALERDTLLPSHQARGKAFEEQAISSQTWGDPRLKFGVMSLPIDGFDLDQEPMTQVILGYQQMLPRGDSLEHASAVLTARSSGAKAAADKRRRQIVMQVRTVWLEVLLHEKSIDIIRENRNLFEQMLEISQKFYATGRRHQQDVVQAELEISLVDDNLEKVSTALLIARASLTKWVGEDYARLPLMPANNNNLLNKLPELAEITAALNMHPELQQANAGVEIRRQLVGLSKDKYSPQWGFDLTYGKRSGQNMNGSDRADFVSAMASFDLPIFTEQKQDRELSASKQRLLASRYQYQDIQRLLIKRLQQVHGRLQKLGSRIKRYKSSILPQAKQNADVAMSGYQSGVVSFFTLTRARVIELKTRLANLRLEIEHAQTFAELNYLLGENS